MVVGEKNLKYVLSIILNYASYYLSDFIEYFLISFIKKKRI